MDEKITTVVGQVLELLASEKFEAAAVITHGVRLSAQEMHDAISQYGRTVIVGPPEQIQEMDVVEVRGAIPKQWSVQIPLWTKEEGRSDLTLELTLIDNEPTLRIEIDDLHVL